MRYYRVWESIDEKIAGKHPAMSEGKFEKMYKSPKSVEALWYEKAGADVEIAKGILNKKAKLVDIISPIFMSGGQYFISDKLKNIFTQYPYQGEEFLPTSVIFNDVEIKDYWILTKLTFLFWMPKILSSLMSMVWTPK